MCNYFSAMFLFECCAKLNRLRFVNRVFCNLKFPFDTSQRYIKLSIYFLTLVSLFLNIVEEVTLLLLFIAAICCAR